LSTCDNSCTFSSGPCGCGVCDCVPVSPAPSVALTDRAGVDAEIHRDCLQRRGAEPIRRCHGCPLVAVCLDKRLERLEQRRSLHLRHCVEVLRSPQPHLHEQFYTKLMCIAHLLEQTSRQARAFPVIGDNEEAC